MTQVEIHYTEEQRIDPEALKQHIRLTKTIYDLMKAKLGLSEAFGSADVQFVSDDLDQIVKALDRLRNAFLYGQHEDDSDGALPPHVQGSPKPEPAEGLEISVSFNDEDEN